MGGDAGEVRSGGRRGGRLLGVALGLVQLRARSRAEVLEGLPGRTEHSGAPGPRGCVAHGAVLVIEQHEVPGGGETRGRARVLEELEVEQGQRLGAGLDVSPRATMLSNPGTSSPRPAITSCFST